MTSGYFSLHSKLTPLPGKPAAHVFQEALDNMGPSHRHFSAVAPKPRGRDTSCSAPFSKLLPRTSISMLLFDVFSSSCEGPSSNRFDLSRISARSCCRSVPCVHQALNHLSWPTVPGRTGRINCSVLSLDPVVGLPDDIAHGSWLTAHAHQEHWTCREPSHTNHFWRSAARTFCDHQPLSWPSCTPYCAPFDHLGMERGCWCGT